MLCNKSYGWLNHLTFNELKNLLPSLDLSKFSIFTTVRNPWDRLVSEFFWKSSTSKMKISFTEFVNCIYNKNINHIQCYYKSPIAFSQHIKPQLRFLPEDKEIKMTVIKFENLQKEFDDFCFNRRIPIKTIPRTRASNQLNYREYYNHKTIRLVKELYQEDIKRFNYSFS